MYKEKYLKYKNKYVSLKNQIGGDFYSETIKYIESKAEYSNIKPMLNIPDDLLTNKFDNHIERNLGFNGWDCVNEPSIVSFHRSALSWTPKQFDTYFINGMLREIIFLLTGVNITNQLIIYNKKDAETDIDINIDDLVEEHYIKGYDYMKIIMPVYHFLRIEPFDYHDVKYITINGIKQKMNVSRYGEILNLLNEDNVYHNEIINYIYKNDYTPISPNMIKNAVIKSHEISQISNNYSLESIALNTQDVIIQIYDFLMYDKQILFLARRFHRQKAICENLQKIIDLIPDGILKNNIYSELLHQDKTCESFQVILYTTIKDILKKALETYIKPFINNYINSMNIIDDNFILKPITISDQEKKIIDIMKPYNPIEKLLVNISYINKPTILTNANVIHINSYKFNGEY